MALLVLYPLYMHVDPSTYRTNAVGNIGMTLASGWAAVACLSQARRDGPYARVVLLFGLHAFIWMCGQAAWTYYEVFAGRAVPFPSAADLGYLSAMPFGVAAALAIPRQHNFARVRAFLDGLLVALSLIYAAWPLVLRPIVAAGENDLQVLLGFAYPFGDTIMIAIVVSSFARIGAGRIAPYLLLAGLLGIALADAFFAYLSVTDHYTTGNPIDLGWLVGFLLIAAGGWSAHDTPRAPARPGPVVEETGVLTTGDRLRLLMPFGFLLPMIVTTTGTLVTGRQLDLAMILLACAAFLVMMLRQVVTLFESEGRAKSVTHSASHDDLTGLWNRQRLLTHLEAGLRDRKNVVVLFVDVDDFKDINDSADHSTGDQVLKEVAARLAGTVRSPDYAARLGGDEFGIAAWDAGVKDAVRLAERVVEALSEPVMVEGRSLRVSGSVGVAVGPQDGETPDVLLRNADLAMYAAKQHGKGRYEMYDPSMHAGVLNRLEVTSQLERALRRDELRLHFQPKYDLHTGAMTGAEALLRWEHPVRGLLRPPDFIAAAEASGLIVPIGLWVLEEALGFQARFAARSRPRASFEICVNVAARQLEQPDFVERVAEVLARHPVAASSVVLELTESALIDAASAVPMLARLKDLGVRIAIDDFGTGYSSLSYLHRFPVDILKIDRAFVADVDRGVEQRAMAEAIVSLGRSLRLKTVAEGIERLAQLVVLRDLGCTLGQGYYWAPPLPELDFLSLVGAGHAADPTSADAPVDTLSSVVP